MRSEVLTDEADEELIAKVTAVATAVPSVSAVSDVRARHMGHYTLVDLKIQIANPRLSLTAAQRIITRVRKAIMAAQPVVTDVLVHMSAPHTEEHDPLGGAEHRTATLEAKIRNAAGQVEGVTGSTHVTIHYIDGSASAEVVIVLDAELLCERAGAISY